MIHLIKGAKMKKHEAKELYELIEKWLKGNRNRLIQDMSIRLKEREDKLSIGGYNDTVEIYLTIRKKK